MTLLEVVMVSRSPRSQQPRRVATARSRLYEPVAPPLVGRTGMRPGRASALARQRLRDRIELRGERVVPPSRVLENVP